MPTVPRTQGPSVRSEILPGAQLDSRVDSSGTRAIAAAAQQAGTVVGQIYQEERAKADEAALFDAQNRLSNWERDWFDPQNPKGVRSTRGKDALELPERMRADFEQYAGKVADGLRTEGQKAAFQRLRFDFENSYRQRVDKHVLQEHEAYVEQTEVAAISTAAERTADAAAEGRWDAMGKEAQIAHDQIATIGRRKGMPAEAIKLEQDKFDSSTIVTATSALVTRGDAAGALKFWQANADDMLEEDRARLAPQMRRVELGVRETEEAGRIIGQHGTGSGAIRAAEKIGDPDLRDKVIIRIDAEAGRRERAQRQSEQALTDQLLRRALQTDPSVPFEDLVPPALQANMDPRDVMTARNFRAAQLRGEEVQTDPREYQRLWMLSDQELVATDVRKLVLERKIAPADADRFIARQREINAPEPAKFKWDSEADMYRQAELVMGVDPTTIEGKIAAGAFRMAVDRAIGEREAGSDRSLTREEKWKLMNELMLPAVRERSFWGMELEPAKARAYETRGNANTYLDPALVKRARADLEAKMGPGDKPISDQEVTQYLQSNAEIYNRQGATNGQ